MISNNKFNNNINKLNNNYPVNQPDQKNLNFGGLKSKGDDPSINSFENDKRNSNPLWNIIKKIFSNKQDSYSIDKDKLDKKSKILKENLKTLIEITENRSGTFGSTGKYLNIKA